MILNVFINNTGGTLNLTVAGSTFTSAQFVHGFHLVADGTANVTANFSNSTFSNNFSDGLDAGAFSNSGTSTSAITITSSHFVNNGANGILIAEAGSSNTWFNIHDNTDITGNPSLGINLFMNNQFDLVSAAPRPRQQQYDHLQHGERRRPRVSC